MNPEDFFAILDEYSICYKLFDTCKGKIDYKDKIIYLNPIYNEEAMTLCHEVLHHYFDKIHNIRTTEEIVEMNAEIFYKDNKETIDEYVERLLG